MSTYWDLYCVTCKVEAGAFHWNHGDGQLRELIPYLGAIAAFGGIADEVRWYGPETQDFGALVEFAKAHAIHDVRPRNEYRQLDDQCVHRWICETCNAQHNCTKPRGHTDPHGPPVTAAHDEEFLKGYDQAVDEIISHFEKLPAQRVPIEPTEIVNILRSIWRKS